MRRLFAIAAILALLSFAFAYGVWWISTPPSSPANVIPATAKIRNVASDKDYGGLSFQTAIEVSAICQGVPELIGFQKWAKSMEAGTNLARVDKLLKDYAADKGVSVPGYTQLEGGVGLLGELRDAVSSGRVPCVSYGYSPTVRYGASDSRSAWRVSWQLLYYRGILEAPQRCKGVKIAHMVNLVHLDARWAAIWDSNYPGDGYEWMTASEFGKVFADGGYGWAFILH